MMSEKDDEKKTKKKRKNGKYIQQLNKRLANTQGQANRTQRLTRIKEQEIQNQMQDRPKLSKGTHQLTKNIDIKNVFERQQFLTQRKVVQQRESAIAEKYKTTTNVVQNLVINEKSKSLQRTIEDLYLWEDRKQK